MKYVISQILRGGNVALLLHGWNICYLAHPISFFFPKWIFLSHMHRLIHSAELKIYPEFWNSTIISTRKIKPYFLYGFQVIQILGEMKWYSLTKNADYLKHFVQSISTLLPDQVQFFQCIFFNIKYKKRLKLGFFT